MTKKSGRALTPEALGAMAEAVQRSREALSAPPSQDRPPAPTPAPEARAEPHRRHVGPTPATRPGRETDPSAPRRGRLTERRLATAVVVAAVVVLSATVALAAVRLTGGSPPHTPGVAAAPLPHHGPRRTTTTPGTAAGAPPKSSVSAPPPTTAPPPPAGAAPVLMSLDPATGTANQSVVISGNGFLSPNGQIVARFDGQVVPTHCPVQTTCTVTVPALPGPPSSITVTVTTESGTSNPLPFAYV